MDAPRESTRGSWVGSYENEMENGKWEMALSQKRRGWLPRIADLKRLAPWQSFHADRVLLPSPDNATHRGDWKKKAKAESDRLSSSLSIPFRTPPPPSNSFKARGEALAWDLLAAFASLDVITVWRS